jgi:hypothetical protein
LSSSSGSPVLTVDQAASIRARVPQAISASSRICGYRPGPMYPPGGSPNALRFAGVSVTSSRVPSAETFSRATSRPNAVIPGRCAAAGTVPHSRPNSAFSGARPRRRRAWTAADTVGIRRRLIPVWALSCLNSTRSTSP